MDVRGALYWLGVERRALGLVGLLRFRVQRARSRRAQAGTVFRLSTPFADHPVLFRAGTSDLEVFWQIFVEREYQCLDDLADAEFVVDCGSNVGYASVYFLSRYPGASLVAIEPEPSNVAMLERNLEPYAGRYRVIRSGVWSTTVGLVIEEDPSNEGKQWAFRVRPSRPDETPQIDAVDLASVLDEAGRTRVSVLKVDIEGSEIEVFSHPDGWLDCVDNLVIELHGPECERVVHAAMDPGRFDVSRSGELTVFRPVAA